MKNQDCPVVIREIEPQDNAQVEYLIRYCLKEFGGDHEGTAWEDPNLSCFYEFYQAEGSAYWVAEQNGTIVGGVGIGPMEGDLCELQKMYCLPEARGTGIAHQLIHEALAYGQERYGRCYLETFENMIAAQKFYEGYGFRRIDHPLGNTGHFACDVLYLKDLSEVIRTGTIDDLDAMAIAEERCFPPHLAADKTSLKERLTIYPNHFKLLLKDGEIASYVNGMTTNERDLLDDMYHHATMHEESGKWQMIFGVGTVPEYRNHGYAGLLLKQMIKDAKREGRAGVVLTCLDDLVPYYTRFGLLDEGISEESTHGNERWHQMRITFQVDDSK